MNNKGQMGVGAFILVAVVIIVGVILFIQIATDVGTITSTRALVNESFVTGANGTATAIPGQAVVGTLVLTNQTGEEIGSGNYTVADNQVIDGRLTATITVTNASYASLQTYIDATMEPDGYLPSSSRSMATIIVLLTAFAIAAVALIPTIQSKVLEFMGK